MPCTVYKILLIANDCVGAGEEWWPQWVSAYTQTYVSCTKCIKFYIKINKKYSTASDVWSFGALMYEIWSLGHKPFEGKTNHVEM